MASTVEALSSTDLTKVGIIVTVALVVVGLLLSILITAIVGRLIVAVVVVVLAIFVWQQRSHVEDRINNACDQHATYFGFHLDVPDSVKQKCDVQR
jgi:hypothetical protein